MEEVLWITNSIYFWSRNKKVIFIYALLSRCMCPSIRQVAFHLYACTHEKVTLSTPFMFSSQPGRDHLICATCGDFVERNLRLDENLHLRLGLFVCCDA